MVMGLVRLARRHLVLVVVLALVGALVGVLAAMFVLTPVYTAETKLYVSGQGSDPDARLQNGEYARTHVSSYADMAGSDAMAAAVRARLGVAPSSANGYQDVGSTVEATNPLNTLIIDVTVQSSTAQQALAVATALGEVYDSVVAQAEVDGSGQSPVRVSVLSAPGGVAPRTGPDPRVFGVAGLLGGLAVGLLGAWLVERPRRERAVAAGVPDWSWDKDVHLQPVDGVGEAPPVDLAERRLRAESEVTTSAAGAGHERARQ